MSKALVIVESPAKAKTINKYLGKQYVVKASLGHVKDLPKKDLAVDVENGFEPRYELIEGKKKLMQELKQAAKKNAFWIKPARKNGITGPSSGMVFTFLNIVKKVAPWILLTLRLARRLRFGPRTSNRVLD